VRLLEQTNKFRHELKYFINECDAAILRSRLNAVMKHDPHTCDGQSYVIRSLYFDNINDRALFEKLDGVDRREKFRIRYYNYDTGRISLEKKCKISGLCLKEDCLISSAECGSIIKGDIDFMCNSGRPLLTELYYRIKADLLRPKNIVIYTREPYIYEAGNVRVTLDSRLRTVSGINSFLSPYTPCIPLSNNIILEVKYDEFLPDVIYYLLSPVYRRAGSYSKYAATRLSGV
jgi:hypothetical protein